MRDRAKTKIKQWIYGAFALGWRGSQRHWQHYEVAYLMLAGLATPLVLSVHSIVSMDFAVSQLPGWHTTIFPPYFVAGAIFSGFAMVITLMVICAQGLRPRADHHDAALRLHGQDHPGHGLDGRLRLRASSSSSPGTAATRTSCYVFVNRATGAYAWAYWTMVSCNVLVAAAVLVQEAAHRASRPSS